MGAAKVWRRNHSNRGFVILLGWLGQPINLTNPEASYNKSGWLMLVDYLQAPGFVNHSP